MKNILTFCLFLLLFVCCSDDSDKVFYETDNLLLKNNITDVTKVFAIDQVQNEKGVILYYGNRRGKDWFALFDVDSEQLIIEWFGKDRFYERPELDQYTEDKIRLLQRTLSGDYFYVYEFDYQCQLVCLMKDRKVEYKFELEDGSILYNMIGDKLFNGFIKGKPVVIDMNGNEYVDDLYEAHFESENPLKYFYIGFKDKKVWLGYYDDNAVFQEALSVKDFERKRKIHHGYDEYEDVIIGQLKPIYSGIDEDYFSMDIRTDWGYVFVTEAGSCYDVFCVNENKIYFYPNVIKENYRDKAVRNWFKGSLLIDQHIVLSPKAEEISVFDLAVPNNCEPVSYEEGIVFGYKSINRTNLRNSTNIWTTEILKLNNVQSNARISYTLLDKKGMEWLYNCNIVNESGSKEDFKFKVHIESGDITYL